MVERMLIFSNNVDNINLEWAFVLRKAEPFRDLYQKFLVYQVKE